MPEFFIQLFGVVFLVGICVAASLNGSWWLLGEGIGVAFAMIGVRTLLRNQNSELNKG